METQVQSLQIIEKESLLTSNKAAREDFAKAVVQDVAEGNEDAIKVLLMAKKAIEVFTIIEKNVKPYVAGKQIQKGGITLYEAQIVEKKDPDKIDFSVCDDEEWNNLTAKAAKIKEQIKERESFLKTLRVPMATMEGVVINPPAITYGAQNIAITLK